MPGLQLADAFVGVIDLKEGDDPRCHGSELGLEVVLLERSTAIAATLPAIQDQLCDEQRNAEGGYRRSDDLRNQTERLKRASARLRLDGAVYGYVRNSR